MGRPHGSRLGMEAFAGFYCLSNDLLFRILYSTPPHPHTLLHTSHMIDVKGIDSTRGHKGHLASFYHPDLFIYADSADPSSDSSSGPEPSSPLTVQTPHSVYCPETSSSSPTLQTLPSASCLETTSLEQTTKLHGLTPAFVSLGRTCLAEDPLQRPSFELVVDAIQGMLKPVRLLRQLSEVC